MIIDLADNIADSKFFTWDEALFLPRWGISVFPINRQIMHNIERTAMTMDKLRDFFNAPLKVTSWYRPMKYNELIGGAKASSHITGLAVDFLVKDLPSVDAREILRHELLSMNIRMERLETPHVHIDLNCTDDMPLEKRYFLP